MQKKDIGINAGTIWQLLSEKGRLSVSEIVKLTGLVELQVGFAIGWLSKENKICFLEKNNTIYVDLVGSSSCTEMYY